MILNKNYFDNLYNIFLCTKNKIKLKMEEINL